MAKKEETKKKSNEGREQEKEGKEVKTLRIKDTNITQFSCDQLLDMWNGSTDDDSFKKLYPEATFTREQAKYQLQKAFGMVYMAGFMVPRGVDKEQIIELINSLNGNVQKASEKQQLIYSCAGESRRITISVKEDTLERWQAMLEERGVRKAMIQGYYTMALESFMELLKGGVRIMSDM